jgi:hypothetical protein
MKQPKDSGFVPQPGKQKKLSIGHGGSANQLSLFDQIMN